MPDLLPAIELETAPNPRWSVIWLHGLGADGSDFESVVPELGLPDSPGVRFVFPHAPAMPVTCNGGYVMPAWYDIISLEPNSRVVWRDYPMPHSVCLEEIQDIGRCLATRLPASPDERS